MVSSCFITRRHSVPSTAVGTVVDALELERSFRSVLGRLESRSVGAAMPNAAIWSAVNKLPQILEAASMPSEASDAVSI